MNTLLPGSHPAFDTLSALADMPDVAAARTRVGRHVAACSTCAATVADIRALGAAARDVELPGAPDGLWTRIEAASRAGAPLTSPGRAQDEVAPREEPRHSKRARRGLYRAATLAAAAAAVAAALLLPVASHQRLDAAASGGRWRFEPAMPVPGALVSVRYEPRVDVRGGAEPAGLLLLGGGPVRWDDPVVAVAPSLEDSLAVLHRQPDGAWAGSFVFPRDQRALVVRLRPLHAGVVARVMSTSGPVARQPEPATILVSGQSGGRPSLAALSEASHLWTEGTRSQFDVGDTLIRYFPAEPLGYAVSGDGGPPHRVLDEVIAWFHRGEHEYLKFDERYMKQRVVPADREVAMVQLANRIDEPVEARKWALRLAHEHGGEPRALYIYTMVLRQMLTRPATTDSVRRDLPLADTLWERNGHHDADLTLAYVAQTAGDTAASQRWTSRSIARSLAADHFGVYLGVNDAIPRDPALRDATRLAVRRHLAEPCELPAGKYPVYGSRDGWRTNCETGHASAYAALSLLERLDARPRQALVLADSSLAAYLALGQCADWVAHRRRGEALLDLRDTAAAIPELAAGLGYGSWQSNGRRDSLGVALRGIISAEAWRRLADSANARGVACGAERARRTKAAAAPG